MTASGSGIARCGIATDSLLLIGSTVNIECTDPRSFTRTSIDSDFSIALIERGRPGLRAAFAYTAGLEEVFGTVTVSASQSYNSSGGAVTQRHLNTGHYEMTFAGLAGGGSPENVQVSSASENGDYCKILGWRVVGQDLVVEVQCYESDTLDPEDQDFTIIIFQ